MNKNKVLTTRLFYFIKCLSFSSCILAFSCNSTKVTDLNDLEQKDDSNNLEVVSNSKEQESNSIKSSDYDLFLKKIDNLTLEVISTPKDAIKTKKFTTPFVIKASKIVDTNASFNTSLEDIEIDVTYPISRNVDTNDISYKTDKVSIIPNSNTLDSNLDENSKKTLLGTIEFTPPETTFSVKDKITFSPTISINASNSEKFLVEAQKHSVSTDYNVKTNLRSSGGVISLVEFKKDGTPLKGDSISSSKLLINLIKNGFSKIGNDDFTNAILKGDESQIFKETKKYNGTMTYLIFGTVKYDDNPDENATKAVNLIGTVSCMNLKDASILYRTTQKISEKDMTTARESLSKKLADSINYGM